MYNWGFYERSYWCNSPIQFLASVHTLLSNVANLGITLITNKPNNLILSKVVYEPQSN